MDNALGDLQASRKLLTERRDQFQDRSNVARSAAHRA